MHYTRRRRRCYINVLFSLSLARSLAFLSFFFEASPTPHARSIDRSIFAAASRVSARDCQIAAYFFSFDRGQSARAKTRALLVF